MMKLKWFDTRWILLFGLLSAIGIAGCGEETIANHQEFDDLHPTVGQIDFKGEPIPDATVSLYPIDAVMSRTMVPAASAVVDESGKFEVFTYRPEGKGLGAPQGEYEVSISWRGPLKGLTNDQIDELEERLPTKYLNPKKSGIKVSITDGENTLPAISLQ